MGTGIRGDEFQAYSARNEDEALDDLCKFLYAKKFKNYNFIAFKDLYIYYDSSVSFSYDGWGRPEGINHEHYVVEYKAIGVENEKTLDYLLKSETFVLIVEKSDSTYKYKKM